MEIKPIRKQQDYERTLRRIEELWDAPKGSPEDDELDVLTTLIEAYEREHYPVELPDPVEAIRFRLEQTGKDSQSLIGVIGGRTRVYEVLRGIRPLSLNMIRALHRELNIPAEVLIQKPQQRRRRGRRAAANGRRATRARKLA